MAEKETKTKSNGKRLRGEVISLSGDKTIKVRVEIKKKHGLYGKIIKSHKNYLAHNDPVNGIGVSEIAVGDLVEIEETRPISKNKNFVLIKKIKRI